VVSYANLGGLGAREGIPVAHTWEPPLPEPPEVYVAATTSLKVLPWLLILLPLFLFRPNRCSTAWWIWLPVVLSAVVGITVYGLLTRNERSLPQVVGSFIVGLAAVWLLMPFLGSRHRIVAFFKTLPVLVGFSLLAFVPTLLGDGGGWIDVRPYLAALLAVVGLVATLALTFGGLSVRRRFGRIRLLSWLVVWILLAWTVIAIPFLIMASLESNNNWGEAFLSILLISGITLALLLPLVLLSFFQPLYRARFLDWLKVPQADPSAGATASPKIPGVPRPEGTTIAPQQRGMD
jgi:hypothetical protein